MVVGLPTSIAVDASGELSGAVMSRGHRQLHWKSKLHRADTRLSTENVEPQRAPDGALTGLGVSSDGSTESGLDIQAEANLPPTFFQLNSSIGNDEQGAAKASATRPRTLKDGAKKEQLHTAPARSLMRRETATPPRTPHLPPAEAQRDSGDTVQDAIAQSPIGHLVPSINSADLWEKGIAHFVKRSDARTQAAVGASLILIGIVAYSVARLIRHRAALRKVADQTRAEAAPIVGYRRKVAAGRGPLLGGTKTVRAPSPYRVHVEALSPCSAAEVDALLPEAGGYDCTFAKPRSSRQLLRLQALVQGPVSGQPLTSPLSKKACVVFNANVLEHSEGSMKMVASAREHVDFIVGLVDAPHVHIKVCGRDALMYDMTVGRLSQLRAPDDRPAEWQKFIADHRAPSKEPDSAQGDHSVGTEFQEDYLGVGAAVTLCGELLREPTGALSLQPLRRGTSWANSSTSSKSAMEAKSAAISDQQGEQYKQDAYNHTVLISDCPRLLESIMNKGTGL